MNWKDKHNLFFKLLRLHFGLALYSIGLTLGIQANIGLAPWEAFGIGVSYVTGLTLDGRGLCLAAVGFLGHDSS